METAMEYGLMAVESLRQHAKTRKVPEAWKASDVQSALLDVLEGLGLGNGSLPGLLKNRGLKQAILQHVEEMVTEETLRKCFSEVPQFLEITPQNEKSLGKQSNDWNDREQIQHLFDMEMSKGVLESISDRYAHGECGAFAAACFDKYHNEGWRLVVFSVGDTPMHAACATPQGQFFDAYGFVSLQDIEDRYGQSFDLDDLEDADALMDVMVYDDEDVEEAADHLALLEDALIAEGKVHRQGHGLIANEPPCPSLSM